MQNFTSFHMYLEFNSDASGILIMNRKPVANYSKKRFESGQDKDAALEADKEFKTVKSNASCHFSEVLDFHFGGLNSRFWILRKHINSMSHKELATIPFYSW